MNWKLFDYLRGVVLIGISICALAFCLFAQLPTTAQRESTKDAVDMEHRFTAIETQVGIVVSDLKEAKDDIKDIKNFKWLEALGFTGIMGEAGIRLIKRRKA